MIATIETAILDRLRAAGEAGALGYAFRHLDTYPDDWDEMFKAKAVWRAPAAWVTFGGWNTGDTGDTGATRIELSFGLVVAAENQRNETATRHGGGAGRGEPGSYQLLLDAVGLLAGQDLGLDINEIGIGPARSVRPPAALKERNVSMYAVQLTTGFAAPTVAIGAGDDAFERMHLDWDLPVLVARDPDAALPVDPLTTDATDDLEIPQ